MKKIENRLKLKQKKKNGISKIKKLKNVPKNTQKPKFQKLKSNEKGPQINKLLADISKTFKI